MLLTARNIADNVEHDPDIHVAVTIENGKITGGNTNAQQSTWSPIAPPSHSFHSPENFGKVEMDLESRYLDAVDARHRVK